MCAPRARPASSLASFKTVSLPSWLPSWHTILDVIGCLLTNRCQLEKLLLWMGLRPFRQVADTWPLGPADNQPNPCGAFLNLFDRLGRRIMGSPGTANQRHIDWFR